MKLFSAFAEKSFVSFVVAASQANSPVLRTWEIRALAHHPVSPACFRFAEDAGLTHLWSTPRATSASIRAGTPCSSGRTESFSPFGGDRPWSPPLRAGRTLPWTGQRSLYGIARAWARLSSRAVWGPLRLPPLPGREGERWRFSPSYPLWAAYAASFCRGGKFVRRGSANPGFGRPCEPPREKF